MQSGSIGLWVLLLVLHGTAVVRDLHRGGSHFSVVTFVQERSVTRTPPCLARALSSPHSLDALLCKQPCIFVDIKQNLFFNKMNYEYYMFPK